jgi:hypothetical protein
VRRVAVFFCYLLATLCVIVLIVIGLALKRLYAGWAPEEMTEGNCWSYAIPHWLKSPRSSYLTIRLSASNAWPHVFYSHDIDGLQVEEFRPVKRLSGWKSYFAAVWFRGHVRNGFGEAEK